MAPKSTKQFVIRSDCIIHSETGEKLPYIYISEKTANYLTSGGVVVEFDNYLLQRREEELSWLEYRSGSKFCKKMIAAGYHCRDLNLFKALHEWFFEIKYCENSLLASSQW